MITGKSSGSGRYAFEQASLGRNSVIVSQMPEDNHTFRITFQHNGESQYPIVRISEHEAELLWSCLKRVAEGLKWSDEIK